MLIISYVSSGLRLLFYSYFQPLSEIRQGEKCYQILPCCHTICLLEYSRANNEDMSKNAMQLISRRFLATKISLQGKPCIIHVVKLHEYAPTQRELHCGSWIIFFCDITFEKDHAIASGYRKKMHKSQPPVLQWTKYWAPPICIRRQMAISVFHTTAYDHGRHQKALGNELKRARTERNCLSAHAVIPASHRKHQLKCFLFLPRV
jgi:hypothetical protein